MLLNDPRRWQVFGQDISFYSTLPAPEKIEALAVASDGLLGLFLGVLPSLLEVLLVVVLRLPKGLGLEHLSLDRLRRRGGLLLLERGHRRLELLRAVCVDAVTVLRATVVANLIQEVTVVA